MIRPVSELGGSREEDTAARQRIRHLSALRGWAEPLGLGPAQASFHVIEAPGAADAILEFARQNRVNHIVIGAPARDIPLRGLLGTVATQVALEAPCTVTIVRA